MKISIHRNPTKAFKRDDRAANSSSQLPSKAFRQPLSPLLHFSVKTRPN
jgi:hypothetical protein